MLLKWLIHQEFWMAKLLKHHNYKELVYILIQNVEFLLNLGELTELSFQLWILNNSNNENTHKLTGFFFCFVLFIF